MNANELADELQKMFRGEEYDRLIHEIPDMLRQQQNEIEALKMGFAGNGTSDSELAEVRAQANRWFLKIKEQQAEIEALKKEAALQRLSDFTQEFEAKYSDAWWKEVDEFNKQLKAQEK